jgi:hypothetical protein
MRQLRVRGRGRGPTSRAGESSAVLPLPRPPPLCPQELRLLSFRTLLGTSRTLQLGARPLPGLTRLELRVAPGFLMPPPPPLEGGTRHAPRLFHGFRALQVRAKRRSCDRAGPSRPHLPAQRSTLLSLALRPKRTPRHTSPQAQNTLPMERLAVPPQELYVDAALSGMDALAALSAEGPSLPRLTRATLRRARHVGRASLAAALRPRGLPHGLRALLLESCTAAAPPHEPRGGGAPLWARAAAAALGRGAAHAEREGEDVELDARGVRLLVERSGRRELEVMWRPEPGPAAAADAVRGTAGGGRRWWAGLCGPPGGD